VFEPDGGYHKAPGDLISIPAEFYSKRQIEFYRAAPVGWNVCPLGYNFFVGKDALGRRLVFPGVVFPGVDRKGRKKFPDYKLRFDKAAVEKYIRPHIERSQDLRSERDKLYRNLTHDLRAISNEIYNQALIARDTSARHGNSSQTRNLDRVMAAQQMMSVRLDIIDYESGLFSAKAPKHIKVFRKLEKVHLCFTHKLAKRKLRSSLTGTSFSEVIGPDILEIVFFVIIENAIKYAPKKTTVELEVTEVDGFVVVSVESLGPCIASNEYARIFDRGYRGVAADRLSEGGGSGIGLFAAKSIVEGQFSGLISVSQSPDSFWIDGFNYYRTTFTVKLPIHSKIEKKTFRRRRLFRRSAPAA
jgi:signal transduction histidine kinase